MTRETLLKKTFEKLSQLPDHKLREISDFADFLLYKIEEKNLTEGIQKLASDSKAFDFLEDEEEIYSVKDVKKSYK